MYSENSTYRFHGSKNLVVVLSLGKQSCFDNKNIGWQPKVDFY